MRDARAFGFAQALGVLRCGGRVCRLGWSNRSMWLQLIAGEAWAVSAGEHVRAPLAPFIGMRTADGYFVPWLASQRDILTDDWVEVEKPT